jgi:hypothetical protein
MRSHRGLKTRDNSNSHVVAKAASGDVKDGIPQVSINNNA